MKNCIDGMAVQEESAEGLGPNGSVRHLSGLFSGIDYVTKFFLPCVYSVKVVKFLKGT